VLLATQLAGHGAAVTLIDADPNKPLSRWAKHPSNDVALHYYTSPPNSVERKAAIQKRIWGKSRGQGARISFLLEIDFRNHRDAQPAMFDSISYSSPAHNEVPSPHEPVKDASRRSRGSGGPLSLTVSPLRAIACHGEMKYSAVRRPRPNMECNDQIAAWRIFSGA
jgi:hypothetical protein